MPARSAWYNLRNHRNFVPTVQIKTFDSAHSRAVRTRIFSLGVLAALPIFCLDDPHLPYRDDAAPGADTRVAPSPLCGAQGGAR